MQGEYVFYKKKNPIIWVKSILKVKEDWMWLLIVQEQALPRSPQQYVGSFIIQEAIEQDDFVSRPRAVPKLFWEKTFFLDKATFM